MAGVARYSLEIKPAAGKELDRLDNALFARIDRKILVLADNPRPPGSKKLRGYKDQWRIRVGDWRVVYIIDDAAKRGLRLGTQNASLSHGTSNTRSGAARCIPTVRFRPSLGGPRNSGRLTPMVCA